MAQGKRWTREELFLALNLYHKLTFGQLHERQPTIIALAEKMRRTPGSLAMKLTNLASFDPVLKLRGLRGLPGASRLDGMVWQEFHENLSEAAPASEEALRRLFNVNEEDELEVLPKEGIRVHRLPRAGTTETIANVKIRRGQEYFRDAVLNNFAERCGVCGLPVRDLLVASHILPWSKFPEERLNVRNGLCLSRLHDAAFDQYLIAFDEKMRLLLSARLKAELPQLSVKENFAAFAGNALVFPDDAQPPDQEFLRQHRARFFDLAK